MAISVVQRKSGVDATGTVGSTAVAFTSNVTAGNILIAVTVGADSSSALFGTDFPAPTDTRGNTYTQVFSNFNLANGLGIKVYTTGATSAGANTVTQNNGNDAACLFIFEVSGLATSPFDQSAVAVIAATTAFTSGNTPTTTVADELLIGIAAAAAAETWTLGAGYSNLQSGVATNANGATEEQIVSATGAYSSTLTGNVNGNGLAAVVTFKGATTVSATNDPAFYLKRPTFAPNNLKIIITDY